MTAIDSRDPLDDTEDELALDRSLLTAVAALRWATLAWTVVVVVIDASNDSFEHLWGAVALVGAISAFTIWATVMVRARPAVLLTTTAVAVELGLDAALVFFDEWTYGSTHSQSLGSAWPLAGIIMAGICWAWRGGLITGLGLGLIRMFGQLRFDPGPWSGDQKLAAIGTIVLYALTGGVAGLAAHRLRQAERQISAARAREEVARQLHDGVLQTLAVIQRRSHDPELVSLARDQEEDLRAFLFGATRDDDLLSALRLIAARATRLFGGRVELVAVTEPEVSDEQRDAIVGAVREALNNAGKHGGASHATIYVDVDDDDSVFCSVKDDGCGFDAAHTPAGVGIGQSITARIEAVGGRVEIASGPQRGTEVKLWVPR